MTAKVDMTSGGMSGNSITLQNRKDPGDGVTENQSSAGPARESNQVEPAVPEENLGVLPAGYDVDRLYAVPRDPERVFATWELSGPNRELASQGRLAVRFSFTDGVNSSSFTDRVAPDSHQYYCVVPPGSLFATTQIGVVESDNFSPFLTSGPIGLAIAFKRAGRAEFARLGLEGISKVKRGSGFTPVDTPELPDEYPVSDTEDHGDARRRWIGYLPVSGRK